MVRDRIARSKWSTRLGASLPEDGTRDGFQNVKTVMFFKNFSDGQSPKFSVSQKLQNI